jgi:hypothetical protein
MINIPFPEPRFRLKNEDGQQYIFDTLRKKWLVLTEEEWVRQNFVRYLTEVLQYPSTLLALEKEIMLNDLRKRFDLLVYNQQHQPWLLVECKAPEVPLNTAVLEQALRYNITVPVSYIFITNGTQTFGWKKEDERLQPLNVLPPWNT